MRLRFDKQQTMKKLDVLFNGWGESWTLGTLAANGTETVFEYSPQALKRGVELSPVHLKLRAEAFSGFLDHQAFLPGLEIGRAHV